MAEKGSCSLLVFFLIYTPIIILTISKSTYAQMVQCSNTTMLANNSQYKANLNTLFRYLLSNATNPSGFYHAVSNNGNPDSEAIYGNFLCQGDLNASSCHDCVTTATTDLPTIHCPNRKVAVIWYDNCMVRYSNQSFYGRMDDNPAAIMINYNVTGNVTRFRDLVNNMMYNVIAQRAPNGGPQKKFAVDSTVFNNFQIIYGMGQCTPDLSPSDCNRCLENGITELHRINQGGRFLKPSCIVRYELYPFFNLSLLAPAPPTNTDSIHSSGRKISMKAIIAIVIPVVAVLVATLLVIGICCAKQKKTKDYDIAKTGDDLPTIESLQYNLATLQSATNNFSAENKLGEGGFGSVYKGTLSNGQHIAVKRLSMNSSQGLQEFKNEIILVAKLQHRNLVRLMGFCFDGQEKLLVYEYVPNKSLDKFLFDPEKQALLDWGTRYKIIGGIARGMLYLHHDSQLRIIHRDLKLSNVLLDAEMNAKVSDFGLARIFEGDQTQANTSRVVGTYGYMSPEYAMHGQFSNKSDVYSFGVLILEILSGKRNTTFYQLGEAKDLISYAWKQWRCGKPMEIVDPTIRDLCSVNEATRCIHLGLLCVQESANDRPTMATVYLTLDSFSVTLPVPETPGFYINSRVDSDQSSGKLGQWSLNDVSITELEPR